jgi:hypothetical protein
MRLPPLRCATSLPRLALVLCVDAAGRCSSWVELDGFPLWMVRVGRA